MEGYECIGGGDTKGFVVSGIVILQPPLLMSDVVPNLVLVGEGSVHLWSKVKHLMSNNNKVTPPSPWTRVAHVATGTPLVGS